MTESSNLENLTVAKGMIEIDRKNFMPPIQEKTSALGDYVSLSLGLGVLAAFIGISIRHYIHHYNRQ